MVDIAIVSTARTPVGKAYRGSLNATHGATLGAHAVLHVIERSTVAPEEIDDVLLGCAMPEGTSGMNIARQVVLRAGLPVSVTAQTIVRACASSLSAIGSAANAIACGDARIVVAGGFESISLVQNENQNRYEAIDPWLQANRPSIFMSMIETAERSILIMALSPISPIPDHVPDRLVYDFDYIADPSMREDVHEGALRIAREAPRIFWTPRQGGHWVVAGYRATNDVTRNPAIFSNAALQIPADGPTDPMFPITLDPPEHGKYCEILERAFSPRAMKAMETSITSFADHLICEALAKGGCDFVPSVSEPLPVQVFMKMMGLPLDRSLEFRGWVVEMFSSADLRRKQDPVGKVLGATGELIEERRRRPEDDLISMFISTKIDGEPLTFDQVQAFCLMVFLAGLDTVTNGMSFGIYQLVARENRSTD